MHKAINLKLEEIQILSVEKPRKLAEEIMLQDLPALCELYEKQ